MGISQSHGEFFHPAHREDHGRDAVNPMDMLYRIERTLWRREPPWLKPPSSTAACSGEAVESKKSISQPLAVDPMSAMSCSQALELLPTLMDEKWVAALVALADSVDIVVQSTGLGLLAKILSSAAAESVFIKVNGVQKIMALLESNVANVRYLALQVIFALCSRTSQTIDELSDRGLVQQLAKFASNSDWEEDSAQDQTTLLSLNILQAILPRPRIRSAVGSVRILPLLLRLARSSSTSIANAAVACIGSTIPNDDNLKEMVQLGCIDELLKLMVPSNAHSHAVIQALSVVADHDVKVFPRELTILAVTRTLDTLRGGAKRSKTASTCALLFANLVKSPVFHAGLCTEPNLSIISKLLVGGSTDVLKASAFALGAAAFRGPSTVKEILFNVSAPDHLLKLLDSTPRDDDLVKLILFALASILDEATVSTSGSHVVPARADSSSDSLKSKMKTLCNSMVHSARSDLVLLYSTSALCCSSTFAAKLLCSMCVSAQVKTLILEHPSRLDQITDFVRDAGWLLISSLLVFFVECSTEIQGTACLQFCERVGSSDRNVIDIFVGLFEFHEPNHLMGLLTVFSNFAMHSQELKLRLSEPRVLERALELLTKVNDTTLHHQSIVFLEVVTRQKNHQAISNIFARSPDRIANLLYSTQVDLLAPTLIVLRRLFKRHNSPEIPSSSAKRQLASMFLSDNIDFAIGAVRVWGNMLLNADKRQSFAIVPQAVESLLRLVRRIHEHSSDGTPEDFPSCHVAIRALCRGVSGSVDMQKETANAPSFLVVFDLFRVQDERVMGYAVETMIEIAQVPSLRRFMLAPKALETLAALLRDREPAYLKPIYRISWLRFVAALGKRDSFVQRILAEYRVVDAILLLAHSPVAVSELDVLTECMDTLAWLSTGDSGVRQLIGSGSKLIDLALKYIDCSSPRLVTACLHLLQRLTFAQDDADCSSVKQKIRVSGGPSIIIRALGQHNTPGNESLQQRACGLVRNLACANDAMRSEFQRLGVNPILVALVSSGDDKDKVKVQVRGLQAITAMCSGISAIAKTSKQEMLECDQSQLLLQLVEKRVVETKVCLAWCEAMASVCQGNAHNQMKLAAAQLTVPTARFVGRKDIGQSSLQIAATRLLSFMASLAANRSVMMTEGGDILISALSIGLQSDVHDLQRYSALLVAHLTTRNDDNKVRLGAAGTASFLIDRLSSKQLNVIENVLQAVTKLGSHAGNKVKFGSRVCFEKLLSLVHHDELAIRKGAVTAIAVLIEGNDANKKFLLLCETNVVPELCVLMKSPNGKIVESATLILGELSQLPELTLEISKFIDIVVLVRMVEHVNARIRRAALHAVLNLTKESFNKLRFGVQECVVALLNCLHSEDMLIVELAATSLANLSFMEANALRIAKHTGSLGILLKLAAASATSKDYLSWKEAKSLGLGAANAIGASAKKSPGKKDATQSPSPTKATALSKASGDAGAPEEPQDEVEEDEIDDKLEPFVYTAVEGEEDGEASNNGDAVAPRVLDFRSFPARQTAVLEQALLVISNSAEAYHVENAVEKVSIKVMCQALNHPSELVKRCACYILAVWCKKDPQVQRIASNQAIMPVLIQLLNAPNLSVVEAAMYALGKLAYFEDNHLKLLQLDLLTTVVQSILRKPASVSHEGLMDRTIRLLGTMVRFPKVRQTLKSEEIIADILTQLLQIYRSLAKNTSRLIYGMLDEESLKFFLPKKTVMLLRVVLTEDGHFAPSPKTIRNVLHIFERIAVLEEHKTTIALEDSGEALTRMMQELYPRPSTTSPDTVSGSNAPTPPPNAATVLSLLACLSSSRKIAMILHEKDLYVLLPIYLMPIDDHAVQADEKRPSAVITTDQLYATKEMVLNVLLIARHLCGVLGERAGNRLSQVDFTHLLTAILRVFFASAERSSDAAALSPQSFEALVILDRLSRYAQDQLVFAEEVAVDVFFKYVARWMADAERDGTIQGREQSTPGAASPNLVEYVTPLLNVLLRMAEHETNRLLLVRHGGIPLLLQCITVPILTDALRLVAIQILRRLCSSSTVAAEWFDSHDLVLPLFRYMHMHRHQEEMVLHCLGCLADILENSIVSRRHVIGHSQVLEFLLLCLDKVVDSPPDKIHFAINALECLSTEVELADAMAELDEGRAAGSHLLSLVPQLLLVPVDAIARSTQYFAVEMIGYLTSYNHADRLQLNEAVITRILSFIDVRSDEPDAGEAIALALWTLAHLVRHHTMAPGPAADHAAVGVTKWILEAENATAIYRIVQAGLLPSEVLEANASSVTANALTILLALCTSSEVKGTTAIECLVKWNQGAGIFTALAVHLEAVEREIHLPALRLLAMCMATCGIDDKHELPSDSSQTRDDWLAVFRHLMEWMEVFARDPAQCAEQSLLDAFVCLQHLTTLDSLAPEFRARLHRSGLAEIVANALLFLDPQRKQANTGNDQLPRRRQIHLNALKICANLMEHSATFSERFYLLSVPQAIENTVLVATDDLLFECLVCMSFLADWSSTHELLFSSQRSVARLAELIGHQDLRIAAKVTPLLVLMCSRIPSLPGLCTKAGIQAMCDRLASVGDWRTQDRYLARVTDDCGTMLLSVFANDEAVYALFDQVDVVGRMFGIVLAHDRDVPELPLRVLTKISGAVHTHARLLQLLAPMCRLLDANSSAQLGTPAQHLVLCVLFNLFCRTEDDQLMDATLQAGEATLLPQLLPLAKWVGVSNVASVRIVLKILHTYAGSTRYKALLNDGKHIPALLKLVADSNDEVSVAACKLVLVAIGERDFEIALTVEDGVAVLVRTLQKTSKWLLQCLLLSILRNMCHDSEIPVLIMNEDGVSRLVHFIRERKSVLFAADERLALACKILRYVSAVGSVAAARIVDARGHFRLVELSSYQESSSTNESDRATVMEILANIATAREVVAQLEEVKLHDHCLKFLASVAATDQSLSPSRSMALQCLRSMCKFSTSIRRDVASSTKLRLAEQLEKWLQSDPSVPPSKSDSTVSTSSIAAAILMYLSTTVAGRHAIFSQASSQFVHNVCAVILADDATIDKTKSLSTTEPTSSKPVSAVGIKMLGCLLSDTTPERFRVAWQYEDLVLLTPHLQNVLADHQQPKRQLHALNLLSGSFHGGSFYFPLTSVMLSDLFNLLLISPSASHGDQAERILIKAFERGDEIQRAIAGNQILEQLLIVFTQRSDQQRHQSQHARRPLAPVLTQVLNVSIDRQFMVHPRFISKIVTLLSTSPLASKIESYDQLDSAASWTSDDEDEDALLEALAVYLGLVYRHQAQLSIRDALRSEVNASALSTLVVLVLSAHEQWCPLPSRSASDRTASVSPGASRPVALRDVLVWNLLADCLRGGDTEGPQPAHVVPTIQRVSQRMWLQLLVDMFDAALDAATQTMTILGVIAQSISPDVAAEPHLVRLLTHCMTACLAMEERTVLHASLGALTYVRTGWGEKPVLQAIVSFEQRIPQLIARWFSVFKDQDTSRNVDDARVRLLQLLLLIVSSGYCVEELKSAGIRDVIESNELIPAAYKATCISILSLLGYNADLNAEFQLALDRFERPTASPQQANESLAYLVHFLQLYSLTDEPLQQRAIDVFMQRLVHDVTVTAHETDHSADHEAMTMARIRDLLLCLGRLSLTRRFVELFTQRWDLATLLDLCFSRRRAFNTRGFKECGVLSHEQVRDVVELCGTLSQALAPAAFGTLTDTSFLNAMTFLDDLSLQDKAHVQLCERIVGVFAWALANDTTFDLVSRFASRLRCVLRFITVLSDAGTAALLEIIDGLVKRVLQIQLLGELLSELLTCAYRHASKLKNAVREKLLLAVLLILQRFGQDQLTAEGIYEQSIQVILANVQVPAEMAARCSWDLLAVLTDLDEAVVTLFNFDGIQIMLKELCGPTSASTKPPSSPGNNGSSPLRRVLSTRKSALSAADRAALAAATNATNEVAYRRMEALKCLSKAVRNHDEVLHKIGETPGIPAHLFRFLSSGGSDSSSSDASHVANSSAQEHAAHLIARIASQEDFRASLLSQDHVTMLVEALESVHPAIVLYSLEALYYMSQFALCLDALVRHATVPVLAQILTSSHHRQDTDLFVLGLLATMCAKNKVICRRVVSSNLLPRLREALRDHRAKIQWFAVCIIKSVSKDAELVGKLYEQRVLDVLVTSLASYEPIDTQRKAFGCITNLLNGFRPGMAFVEPPVFHDLVARTVEAIHPLVISAHATAHRSIATGLTVLEAVASFSQEGKDLLYDDGEARDARAIPLVLQLVDTIHSDVKLKALLVVTRWVEDNGDRDTIHAVLLRDEAPLSSLVRVISEERGECLLVALTLLNALLSIDDELKTKLSAMTNDVLLRLLPTLVKPANSSINPMQLRALNEALKSLVAVVRSGAGKTGSSSSLAVISNALAPLVELLRLSSASENLRLNALFLLVNFAGAWSELRPTMMTNGTMHACIRVLLEPHDDKLLQLCLLGIALLTGTGSDFTGVVPELLEALDVILACLTSKNPSVQANAVWVVSNICGEDRLKVAIVQRGAATTLQAILNDTVSGSTSSSGSLAGVNGASSQGRPPSSSQRIREYAPKAIKSLGFAPLVTSHPPPPPTRPGD